MRKNLFFCMIVVIALSACGQANGRTDVPNTTEAIASQLIVDQFIEAYETYDADSLIDLLHDDYVFMDYGLGDGPIGKGNISYFIKESMAEPDTWKAQFDSYIITPDGRFAVLDGSFTMVAKSSGEMTLAPAYVVLEVKDGMLVAETWYYNGEVFH